MVTVRKKRKHIYFKELHKLCDETYSCFTEDQTNNFFFLVIYCSKNKGNAKITHPVLLPLTFGLCRSVPQAPFVSRCRELSVFFYFFINNLKSALPVSLVCYACGSENKGP